MAVLIPSVVKSHAVAACPGGSACPHSSYCIEGIWIYPNLNKTEKFLKLPGAFWQENDVPVCGGRWGGIYAENLWVLGDVY